MNVACNDEDEIIIDDEDCFDEYSYDNTTVEGPSNWDNYCVDEGTLNECGSTIRQSPINIVGEITDSSLTELGIDYESTTTSILYNGHTIEFEFEYEGDALLTFDGIEYALSQFHFHSDSEHTVNGVHSPLEAHLVHYSDEGNIAALGVFFEPGAENFFLSQFMENLPSIEDETYEDEGLIFNASSLLPTSKNYYNYSGSLTTPPCSEIVEWIVKEEALQASQEQIDIFSSILDGNFRAIQPLGDRTISKYVE